MVARAAAALGVTIAAAAIVAGQQPRDVRHEVPGTSSLAGTVVAGDAAHTPLRRVRVTIAGGMLVTPRLTVTDDRGRFQIGALAAGQYAIAADKVGYLKMNYGATRPARQGTSVALADGQHTGGLVITLPRAAVIAGTVTNPTGEPEPDVQVAALRWTMRNGERTLVQVWQAMTDDRGDYRLAGLQAGDYLVSVEPPDAARGPAELIQISDGAVDRLLQSGSAVATAPMPAAPVRPLGPAPVYYPGTVRPGGAITVAVATGEERDGIDIRTALVPMARIAGTVTRANGQPAEGVEIRLTSLGPPAPNFALVPGGRLGPKRSDSSGRYAFPGVPPGEYRLSVSTQPRAARGVPPDPDPQSAFDTVTIDGDDRAVDFTLRAGMTMSGRVVFEGAATARTARITLEEARQDPNFDVTSFTADATAEGSFRLSGLLPARYSVDGTAAGWALKSMMASGRELLDASFELAAGESVTDVVATFTDHPSELSGSLQNSSGVPTSDYFIVVFPADRQFWFPNSRRIASVRPNTSGAYSVRNLPAGEYCISALTDVEAGEWFNPEFLQTLAASSPTRIVIKDGEQKRQDLRIGR